MEYKETFKPFQKAFFCLNFLQISKELLMVEISVHIQPPSGLVHSLAAPSIMQNFLEAQKIIFQGICLSNNLEHLDQQKDCLNLLLGVYIQEALIIAIESKSPLVFSYLLNSYPSPRINVNQLIEQAFRNQEEPEIRAILRGIYNHSGFSMEITNENCQMLAVLFFKSDPHR